MTLSGRAKGCDVSLWSEAQASASITGQSVCRSFAAHAPRHGPRRASRIYQALLTTHHIIQVEDDLSETPSAAGDHTGAPRPADHGRRLRSRGAA